MVAGQGGPGDLLERPDHYLPAAVFSRPVFADTRGCVIHIDTLGVGAIVVQLEEAMVRK